MVDRDRHEYRPDIDGLRAIAVLAVVGFHAFPYWVRGGFVGVDIFFVISGYLISANIFGALEASRFSFAEFYARRIKRIFPALLLLLVVVSVVAWFTLLPNEYKQIGKHTAAGASFVPNFVFWKEAGYFDTASEIKPLLHLWSLGIEEQFYVFWPLLLWAGAKRRNGFLLITLIVALMSFAVNVVTVHTDTAAAFYSPLSRIWELMIGGLLCYFRPPRASLTRRSLNWPAICGILLIGISVTSMNREMPLPGWLALLPTTGACLAIAAGPDAWLNRNLLSNPLMTWVGLISYPLYLWHWPLLSFARILEGHRPEPVVRVGAVLSSILLAWLTYKFAERPIRYGNTHKVTLSLLCLLMAAIGVTGYAIYKDNGVQSRFSSNRKEFIALSRYDYFGGQTEESFWGNNSCFLLHEDFHAFETRKCAEPQFPGRPVVFLVGDSHAAYLSQAIRPFLREHRVNLGQFTMAPCAPLSLAERTKRCLELNNYVLQKILATKPDVLVVFAYYMMYEKIGDYRDKGGYEKILARRLLDLRRAGLQKIIVVGQIPIWDDGLPQLVARKFLAKGQAVPLRTYAGITSASLDWDTIIRSQQYDSGIMYVSLKDLLCNRGGCLVRVGDDLEHDLIVFDRGHLTNSGASYVVDNALRPLLPR